MNDAQTNGAEILCEIRNHVAFITLNRPAALNALSFEMIVELRAQLQRCADDADVRAILLRGAGDKAFCAGGDIRAHYQSFKESGKLHREFFMAEYPLDYLLYSYPKPYVALMDGITMGGGMGLAQGSTLRIVGERTRIAMPEVGIGLFPDVGASYFLSRLPGSLGPYLALSGVQIRGADAIYARLADVYLPPPAIASLSSDLAALHWTDDGAEDVRRLVHSHAAQGLAAPSLSVLRPAIDRHFSHTTVPGILASLESESRAEYADWAGQTAKLMRSRSPTMLCVTLRQLQSGKSLDLADCFRMELGMVEQCFVQGDFLEGVRALLIDKDNSPHWKPARLDEVTEASVGAFFRHRWQGKPHPLELSNIRRPAVSRMESHP
ncbi:MAG: enoyl-CoA hydratase/isomerase [Gammaproteobacteria bacterium]|nr:enoyl-CoA hydratase/isomerase [Gammaproteobacteria bacterium]